MISRLLAALGLILFAGLSIVRVSRTPNPVPASAPDTVFSSERALRHVVEVARRPHAMGTDEHDRVRDYIVAQLKAMGVNAEVQATTGIGTRYQESGRVQNIVGVIPGREPDVQALLLMVHYDGVEAAPAAADDGAGVGALLETVRAIRARTPALKEDIIVLFTDGEESGLIGAAAFVREHPRAKDVAFVMNFDARGTTGKSYMFETGPGNLDAVRALRSAGDVTAASVFTTVYRTLPNDTDLSELSVLDVPALNFAFTGGVERYHTSIDDVAHLDPGSLQHHGQQMLRVASTIANQPLPRPVTGDAVFFDLPIVGLVIYPLALALPLIAVTLFLFALFVRAPVRDTAISAGTVVGVLVLTAIAASFVHLSGHAAWSSVYGLAIASITIGLNASVYIVLRRRGSPAGAYAGVLTVWMLLALVTSLALPGVSYLFVWPVLFAVSAERSGKTAARWVSAAFTLVLLAGLAYGASVQLLGLNGIGVIALVGLCGLVTWLIAPLLDALFASDWKRPLVTLVLAGVVLLVCGAMFVKQTADYPSHASLVYAQNAETGEAYFGSFGSANAWAKATIGNASPVSGWGTALSETGARLAGHAVANASLPAPTLTFVHDTVLEGARRVIVRLNAPKGTTGVLVRAVGEPVVRAAIDAKVVDTTRFRYRSRTWVTQFWNVPDSGAVFSLAIPVGTKIEIQAAARRPGLPASVGPVTRPSNVVAAQSGDVSIVWTRAVF